MTATLATLPLDIILSISAFLSNPLDLLSLSQVRRTTHIFQPRTLTLRSSTWTLRPAVPRCLHLKRRHHTGPNSYQLHTCRVQHHGIATHRANFAMLIFDMQPLTVGGSPRHQPLNVQSVCHPQKAQIAIWAVGARFEGHAGRGAFSTRRERYASVISGRAFL